MFEVIDYSEISHGFKITGMILKKYTARDFCQRMKRWNNSTHASI